MRERKTQFKIILQSSKWFWKKERVHVLIVYIIYKYNNVLIIPIPRP